MGQNIIYHWLEDQDRYLYTKDEFIHLIINNREYNDIFKDPLKRQIAKEHLDVILRRDIFISQIDEYNFEHIYMQHFIKIMESYPEHLKLGNIPEILNKLSIIQSENKEALNKFNTTKHRYTIVE